MISASYSEIEEARRRRKLSDIDKLAEEIVWATFRRKSND